MIIPLNQVNFMGLRLIQFPRVKSGKYWGALPMAIEASESGVRALHVAASYTSRTGCLCSFTEFTNSLTTKKSPPCLDPIDSEPWFFQSEWSYSSIQFSHASHLCAPDTPSMCIRCTWGSISINPSVPCNLKSDPLGRGRLQSCVIMMLSPLDVLMVDVIISPSYQSKLA